MTLAAKEHSSGERLDSPWWETPPGLSELVDDAPGPPLGQQQVYHPAVAPDALGLALASDAAVVDALRDRLVLAGVAALVDDLVRGCEGQLRIGEGHVDVGSPVKGSRVPVHEAHGSRASSGTAHSVDSRQDAMVGYAFSKRLRC